MAQTLQVAGGSDVDGQTTVSFVEQIELGGALELQHGDASFTAASQGVLGGLYAGAISEVGCLAGFQIMPAGAGSTIQALISGSLTGPVMATTAGHQYFFTTYLYSIEVYRAGETYHSSSHPAGSGWGGAAMTADVRFVLEVQDIDPSNPATLMAPATVLYDGVIASAPGFCTYALVNAMNMQCSIAYTYVAHIPLPEVRTALPDANYVTQLVGAAADGGQCTLSSSGTLNFYRAILAGIESAHCGELSRFWAGCGPGGERGERCVIAEGSRRRDSRKCPGGENTVCAYGCRLRERGISNSG